MDSDQIDDDFDEDRGPSRSERKRQAEALQKLGEELVKLSPGRLRQVPMSEPLAEAVRQAQQIKAGGGRRRQLQLIGKLMRQQDPEPIRQVLDRIHNRDAGAIAQQHLAERWRDRLLTEANDALTEFLKQYPGAEAQQLRRLIANARREQAAGKPPRSARELFKLVRTTLEHS